MSDGTDDGAATGASNPRRKRLATWTVIAVLSLLLIAAGVLAYQGWNSTDADVPASGYVALAFGVIFSLAFGIGLMALVFYSSRAGYDEPATLVQEPDDSENSEETSRKDAP
jgi:hypothetical protein